jgi:DNA invertase Pin-like site-specific DNA recombinase
LAKYAAAFLTDTATSSGKLIFGIFAALVEFERELISE